MSRGLPGEAAAFFVLERESTALAAGRKPLATLAATTAGFQPGGGQEDLAGRLAQAVPQ